MSERIQERGMFVSERIQEMGIFAAESCLQEE